jgi:hypothetical protein
VSERLAQALALIDEANREDPGRDPKNPALSKALVYGWRMSEWLDRICEGPSDALILAARAQHIRRWEVPRERFPADRAGYLAWRTSLYRFHAEQLSAILMQVGYDAVTIERAASIVAKRRLKQDQDAQRLEDVACLVFLNYEFARFAEAHSHDKIIAILRKTWSKMSEVGRSAALTLPLPEPLSALVGEALTPLPAVVSAETGHEGR